MLSLPWGGRTSAGSEGEGRDACISACICASLCTVESGRVGC